MTIGRKITMGLCSIVAAAALTVGIGTHMSNASSTGGPRKHNHELVITYAQNAETRPSDAELCAPFIQEDPSITKCEVYAHKPTPLEGMPFVTTNPYYTPQFAYQMSKTEKGLTDLFKGFAAFAFGLAGLVYIGSRRQQDPYANGSQELTPIWTFDESAYNASLAFVRPVQKPVVTPVFNQSHYTEPALREVLVAKYHNLSNPDYIRMVQFKGNPEDFVISSVTNDIIADGFLPPKADYLRSLLSDELTRAKVPDMYTALTAYANRDAPTVGLVNRMSGVANLIADADIDRCLGEDVDRILSEKTPLTLSRDQYGDMLFSHSQTGKSLLGAVEHTISAIEYCNKVLGVEHSDLSPIAIPSKQVLSDILTDRLLDGSDAKYDPALQLPTQYGGVNAVEAPDNGPKTKLVAKAPFRNTEEAELGLRLYDVYQEMLETQTQIAALETVAPRFVKADDVVREYILTESTRQERQTYCPSRMLKLLREAKQLYR
ncbi:MAG: hypothetical protein WC254_01310 [Candidatus Woesearchaeota archaeon]|jgi:hypothetical protein